MKEHRITTILFEGQLQEREIPSFRGAILALVDNNPLYHNHKDGDGFHFRYPLIQYKVLDGMPALVGLDAGAESLETIFKMGDSYELRIGRVSRLFTVNEKRPVFFLADDSAVGPFRYHVRNWLPFSADNYHVWQQKTGLAEKVSFLDSILRGNLLTLFKALGVFFDREIHACIVDLSSGTITYKGISMMSFDLIIQTDVALPGHLGIGKGVSHGFGVIIPDR